MPPLWLSNGWWILMIVRPEPAATRLGFDTDTLYSRTIVLPAVFVKFT